MATAAATRRKPTRRLPPEILTDGEVLALMRACGESDTGLRNRALIAVMYRSGLRVAEALSLYPKDVDAAAGTVRVLCGKGGRSRTVGIDDGGLAVVARWAAVRAALGSPTGRHCSAPAPAVPWAPAKQLGRRSITTTACYLDHICPMAVVDAIRSRRWA